MGHEKGKLKVLLGVTGSIACFKSLTIARLLEENEIDVNVVLTPSAEKFINPLTFSSLIKGKVYTDNDYWGKDFPLLHIQLSHWADLILIAPATYNFLNKFALGICDNLLLSILANWNGLIIFAPAMHDKMWENPILQDNLKRIKGLGGIFLGPIEGKLATGEVKLGRMEEPETIVNFLLRISESMKKLKDKRVLVAYGRTEEDIDTVRVITNRSSGKMGRELVLWGLRYGADVISVCGETSIEPPKTREFYKIRTSSDLLETLEKLVEKVDVLFMAIAVGDFKPKRKSPIKISREEYEELEIHLDKIPDILSIISQKKRKEQTFVGFALEDNLDEERALKKLLVKNVDYLVLNTPETLGGDFTRGFILGKGKKIPFENITKSELSRQLYELISENL